MGNSNTTIYIKASKHTIVHQPQVTLGDIASIACNDKQQLAEIRNLPLYKFPDNVTNKRIKSETNSNTGSGKKSTAKKENPQMEFFTILRVILLIQSRFPQAQVESIGEQDFIVEYRSKNPTPGWINHCKVALLCIVIFFGSAFTIMAFNNDISVTEIFTRFYGQLMGIEKPAVSELEIAYSIGLALGILVFFNHFGRRKFSTDPTPIQVEVNKFTSDCDDTLIENADRKGHEEDVY